MAIVFVLQQKNWENRLFSLFRFLNSKQKYIPFQLHRPHADFMLSNYFPFGRKC